MRARAAILVVLLTVSLTACSSDAKPGAADPTRLSEPSAPLTEITIDCTKYAGVAAKIVAAQTTIYTPGKEADAQAAVDDLKETLAGLKDGAPDDVVAALDNLSAAYGDVIAAIKNPGSDAQQKLATLGEKLSADGQKITAYILSKCR